LDCDEVGDPTDSDDVGESARLNDLDCDDVGESATGSDTADTADTDDTDDGAAAAGEGSSTGGTRRMRAPGGESPPEPADPVDPAQSDPTEPVRPTPDDPATTDDPTPDAGDDPGAGAGGGVIVLPGTQPHNPYRPSTALDTFIRIRDCYTLIPGNPHSAFHCDLDHWTEFDHADPAAGGQTEPGNLGAKDRFAHNAKTHGDWVDDLITDPDGHVRP
ncbi:hypothetical protein HH308_29340, partial [Gordonia sp. TBRC 11910]|nr:hypothetical protein [Gordonia asplenii]